MSGDGTIVVTGAAGFIGSAVARALLARGRRVVGIDNFDPFYGREVKGRNVAEVAAAAGAGGAWELVELDIAEGGAMQRMLESVRPEGVIHLAAKAGVRPSLADPAGYMRTNVVGTQMVLN